MIFAMLENGVVNIVQYAKPVDQEHGDALTGQLAQQWLELVAAVAVEQHNLLDTGIPQRQHVRQACVARIMLPAKRSCNCVW